MKSRKNIYCYELSFDTMENSYSLTRYNRDKTVFTIPLTHERYLRLQSYFSYFGYWADNSRYGWYTINC